MTVIRLTTDNVNSYLEEINQLLKAQIKLLQQAFQEYISDLYSARDEIIKRIEIVNKKIDNMRHYNRRLVQMVIDSPEKSQFLDYYKTTEAEVRNFKFPGYVVPEMLKSLSDLLDQSFNDILDA